MNDVSSLSLSTASAHEYFPVNVAENTCEGRKLSQKYNHILREDNRMVKSGCMVTQECDT